MVRVAREMGLVRFGTLSVDGTKVRALASKRKAMSDSRMLKEEARLREEIQGLLARAGAVDAEEDERDGEPMRGDELPVRRDLLPRMFVRCCRAVGRQYWLTVRAGLSCTWSVRGFWSGPGAACID